MRTLAGSSGVRIFGYVIFCWGALSTAFDFYTVYFRSFPINMGISLGNGAIVLLGLVAIVVAKALKSLENRLQALEANISAEKVASP